MDAREELQALRRLAELEAKAGNAPQEPVAPAKPKIVPEQNMSALERLAAGLPSWLTSGDRQVRGFVQGAADPSVGLIQLGANAAGLGEPVNEAIRKQNKEYTAKQGDGLDVSRIVGNVLSPTNILPATRVAAAAPATLSGRALVASVMGAGGGLANPEYGEDFKSDKAKSVALGAAIGPVAEALGAGGSKILTAARDMIEPNIGRGKQAAARLANEVAGDRQKEIVDAIKKYVSDVPGERVTAGKAALPAGSAEFSALQTIANEIKPSIASDISGANQAARRAAIQTVGQDESALAAAIKARSASVDPLYAAARQGRADIVPVIASIDDLLRRNPGNRELVSELSAVRQGLVDGKGDPRVLSEQIMSVIPTINASLKNPDNAFIQGQLVGIKDAISKAVPGLEKANAEFAAKSVPVNQMQIGQFLEDRLVKPLETGERAGVFAQAMRDAPGTIKKSTGQARYDKLDKVLDAPQMKVVEAVMKNLQSEQTLSDLAKAGGPKAREIVGQVTAPPTAPNWLEATITLINNAAKRVGYRGKEFTMNELSDMMLNNPQELARLMEKATPAEKSAIMQAYEAAKMYGYQVAPQVGE